MSDNQLGVLLEDIQDKLQSLAESMSIMRQDITEMKSQVALIPGVQADFKTVKTAVADYSEQLMSHEGRLQVLEMPARA